MKISELSTEQLIESALTEEADSDERWKYVQTLQIRGTQEVFEAVKGLCESGDASKIALGADVLGQLGTVYSNGNSYLPFKKATIPILLRLIDSEPKESNKTVDIEALQSVIFALGRIEDEICRKRILEFKNHKSEDIRYAVVHGILGIEENDEIQALIQFSSDSDEDVRNWATFGLGSQIETDTPKIRDALFERLLKEEIGDEVCDEIRGEALVGLAERKDERIIEPLIKELSSESVGSLAVEAAGEIADSRLCKVLLELVDWWNIDEDLLKRAIENCCPQNE